MNTIPGWKAFALALLIACPLPAFAIGTVTDGGVTFGYTQNFNTTSGNTVNTDFTGAAAGDQLFESWWFFRLQGDGQEFAFGTPDFEDYTLNGGSVGQLDWLDPSGTGLFSATLGFEVRETGANEGVVFQNLQITNTGLSDLTIDIFHYTDLDLGGSFGNDEAVQVANPTHIELSISDPDTTAPLIAYGADHYQVTTWRALLNELTDDGFDDLNDTGAPFAVGSGADFTGAFQWTRTIAAGSSTEYMVQFGSDSALQDRTSSLVPEPGSGLLGALGLMGLASYGRKARR
ncbi:MAG: PEP-CTERM sorting domain-containing protein [Myxococcota bacterium]